MGAGRRHVDIGPAHRGHFRLAILERRDFLAADRLGHRHQNLHAVADGEDRLVGLVEMPEDLLHPLVDADVFRSASAGDVDGVIIGRIDLGEGLGHVVIVTGLLGIGLVALEVVQRGVEQFARLLVRADDIDLMSDRLHPLIEDEDFILLGEVPDEHQDLFSGHVEIPPYR